MKIKKFYLAFAFVAVAIIAMLYGLSPHWFARTFLDLPDLDASLAHILRAVMGLYLAFGLFWLYAAFHDRYRDAAVASTVVFCAGLVSGRLVSFAADGRPAPLLLLYAAMEFILVPIGLWVMKRPD
jgi:hypothetical protein